MTISSNALYPRVNLCAYFSVQFKTNPSAGDSHLHNLHRLVLLFLSTLDNNFILIGPSKQWVQSRRARGVLKLERYTQRLTHRACMGEAISHSWSMRLSMLPLLASLMKTNLKVVAHHT